MREPLVMLPGMMCDARVFTPQMAAMSPSCAMTFAPVEGARIERMAEKLLSLLPDRFALAGLSLGGVVAMELLSRAPHRITRLALMSTNSLGVTPQSAAAYEPAVIKLKAGLIDEAVRIMLPPETLAPGPQRTKVLTQVIAMARNIGEDRIVDQIRAVQRRRDYQAELRRCKTPVLVLCGEHDRLTPVKRHSFMAGLIPHAELTVVRDAGHLPVLEQPAAVTRALTDWLARPVRPAAADG